MIYHTFKICYPVHLKVNEIIKWGVTHYHSYQMYLLSTNQTRWSWGSFIDSVSEGRIWNWRNTTDLGIGNRQLSRTILNRQLSRTILNRQSLTASVIEWKVSGTKNRNDFWYECWHSVGKTFQSVSQCEEAWSTAALLRTPRHRTQTSTVPMLTTLGNSCPFHVLCF